MWKLYDSLIAEIPAERTAASILVGIGRLAGMRIRGAPYQFGTRFCLSNI